MKKRNIHQYTIYISLLSAIVLGGSCKKLIEIPPSPPYQLSEKDQFSDSASTMTAVANVYSYSSPQFGWPYGDAYLAQMTGMSSDELKGTSGANTSETAFYNYSLTSSNVYARQLWDNPYQTLYTINDIIEHVSSSAAFTATFKAQIVGEMEVMRALIYFNLVNLFGGVPLVTSTNYQVTATLPRSSVDSVYALVISDLKDATTKLTTSYPSTGSYRPNLYVAEALLAKVYLYRQQWQNAFDLANNVIGSNLYSLVTDPNDVFLDGSTEAIWQIPGASASNPIQEAQMFIPVWAPIPAYVVNPFLMNAFETGDLRMQDWISSTIVNTGSGNDTLYYIYKYKDAQASAQNNEDYMILRLADLYLIRAEASANLGNGAAALADVNVVRARAQLGASTANPSSQTAVLNAIMHERQVELFTEWGNRWFDLKRTGTAGTVLSAEKTGWQANAALYPIPITERQANVNLSQNPGY